MFIYHEHATTKRRKQGDAFLAALESLLLAVLLALFPSSSSPPAQLLLRLPALAASKEGIGKGEAGLVLLRAMLDGVGRGGIGVGGRGSSSSVDRLVHNAQVMGRNSGWVTIVVTPPLPPPNLPTNHHPKNKKQALWSAALPLQANTRASLSPDLRLPLPPSSSAIAGEGEDGGAVRLQRHWQAFWSLHAIGRRRCGALAGAVDEGEGEDATLTLLRLTGGSQLVVWRLTNPRLPMFG